MAQNLLSSNVHVFPFGTARKTDPLGRVLNENNLTTLVKKLTDKTAYVISDHIETSANTITKALFEFMIEGYYFRADIADVIAVDKPLYACIELSDVDGYTYLCGNDIIGTVLGGSGQPGSPFILSAGLLDVAVDNTKVYYTYTFEQAGTITIQGNNNLIIEGDIQTVSTEDDLCVIRGNEGDIITFSLSSVSKQDVQITVLTPNVFTGLQFYTSLNDIDNNTTTKKFTLQLLDKDHNVPAESYSRFDAGSVSLTVDKIVCGDAATTKNQLI